ncbi:MAG: HPF/RaiA family ribosome-associated protein [Steroidobacteraceae bacterium]
MPTPRRPSARARVRKPDSARRAPLPAHIRAEQRDLAPDDRTYIQRKLGTRLGKFARSIERISVRTDDANGPRGGIDRLCRIKVVLRGAPSVVYESRSSSLDAAVDGALAGIERAVRRTLQRRRTLPRRQPKPS